jgi:flagellar M-ring protein FliF
VDALRQAWTGIRGRVGELSTNQRLLLGMVAAAVVLSASVFGLWLGREEQAVLFTDLTAEDASAALAELGKRDVDGELANGGTTILVPASQVHRLRVDLAAKGVLSSGVIGYELFDDTQWGKTEQDYEVMRLRALQGELTKTIQAIRGVDAARVHLAMPKTSIFRDLASEPTASVMLTLSHRMPPGPDTVSGIQNLVAQAVEGLQPASVTVVDQNGRTLSEAYADDAAGASDRQLEIKKEVEQYLRDKAETMLGSVLGEGRSHVRVDARLNFEKIESQRTVFDPDAQVVRSEERNESTDPQTGGGTSSTMTNYEINQTVEHVVGEVGGVEQLSVAVSVDGNYSTPADGGAPVYEPLPQEELDNIGRMVESAIGLDRERGDRIEVVNLQFRTAPEDAPGGGAAPIPWLDLITRHGGRVLLVIMLVVLVIALRRNLGAALGELAGGRSGAAGGPATTATGDEAGADAEGERFNGMPELTDQMIEDVREYASENPERVAEVVQSWLYEPERSGGR